VTDQTALRRTQEAATRPQAAQAAPGTSELPNGPQAGVQSRVPDWWYGAGVARWMPPDPCGHPDDRVLGPCNCP